MKAVEAGVYGLHLYNAGRTSTRFLDTDVGYCAVDARWKSNEWQSAESV